MADEFIWIARWKEFQHYKPDPARGPAWIKAYTAQLDDIRYLSLTDRQRALLWDLRMLFAAMRGWVPYSSPTNARGASDDAPTTLRRTSHGTATITRGRHSQTRHVDIEALSHAGFIHIISRETLEKRLEQFYSDPRAEVEGEKEVDRETSLLPSVGNYAGPKLVEDEAPWPGDDDAPDFVAEPEEGRKSA